MELKLSNGVDGGVRVTWESMKIRTLVMCGISNDYGRRANSWGQWELCLRCSGETFPDDVVSRFVCLEQLPRIRILATNGMRLDLSVQRMERLLADERWVKGEDFKASVLKWSMWLMKWLGQQESGSLFDAPALPFVAIGDCKWKAGGTDLTSSDSRRTSRSSVT